MRFYRELDAILAGKRSPRLYYPPATHRSTKTTPSLLSELLQVARSLVQRLSKSRSLPLPVRFRGIGPPSAGGWSERIGRVEDLERRGIREGSRPSASAMPIGRGCHARGAHRHAGTPDGTTRNEVGLGISSQLCQLEWR